MRILFCCQYYTPSVGGVQEVIRQLAERLFLRGHEVTIVTTLLPARTFNVLNGVSVKGFAITGNHVTGMKGDIDAYHDFVIGGGFDVSLIYAAQQWTFDALWPVLDKLPFPKVFLPCGFAGLYEPGYKTYFKQMPDILAKFDHLIFNATQYRDIEFARKHGLTKYSVLPNGASELEFQVPADAGFRDRHGIRSDSFLFLTVGSFTGLKGHQELAAAFAQLRLSDGRHATLILNGNEVARLERGVWSLAQKFVGLGKTYGFVYAIRQAAKKLFGVSSTPRTIAQKINASQLNKLVLVTDLPRPELVQAFMAADLFVFASNIEYSPLVLFESAAAGTPFLTVDVGNALEIAHWTEAGETCPSRVDARGYTRVAEAALAQSMARLMEEPALLDRMGQNGRHSWQERFTWNKITDSYELLFENLVKRQGSKAQTSTL